MVSSNVVTLCNGEIISVNLVEALMSHLVEALMSL